MQKITFADIRPFVRFSSTKSLESGFCRKNVHACDNRLLYVFAGELEVRMNEKTYTAKAGDLFLYPPSVCYSLLNRSDSTVKTMSVNFDYCGTEESERVPRPAVPARLWSPEQAIEQLEFTDVPELNGPLYLDSMQILGPLFTEMTAEALQRHPHRTTMRGLMMHQVLLHVHRRLLHDESGKGDALAEKIAVYIRENCFSPISNHSIAAVFSYHPNYINRLFKKHFGQSMHQYVITCRTEQALTLLRTTSLSVEEIAQRVGFSSLKHFSITFKRLYGCPPNRFRE